MLSRLKTFFTKSPYTPLITVRLSSVAVRHNLEVFAKEIGDGRRIAPVLKANAYGHGLVEIARIVEREPSVAFVCVDSLFEARVLRDAGVRVALLVVGYTRPADICEASQRLNDVAFVVASLAQARELARCAQTPVHVHIKVNTGMNRQGIELDESDAVFDAIASNTHLHIDGLCTHFASADAHADDSFTISQIARFVAVQQKLVERGIKPTHVHASATKGFRFAKHLDTNVFRLGIGLYGIDPTSEHTNLAPVLSVYTIATNIRTINKGESVGYNRTFVAPRTTTIATIPMGYYEGIDRRLSNVGCVRVRDVVCPIVGRVSMNMTTIDVSAVPNIHEGERVEVMSDDPGAPNTVAAMAKRCDTIPYDILVHINGDLKREVV